MIRIYRSVLLSMLFILFSPFVVAQNYTLTNGETVFTIANDLHAEICSNNQSQLALLAKSDAFIKVFTENSELVFSKKNTEIKEEDNGLVLTTLDNGAISKLHCEITRDERFPNSFRITCTIKNVSKVKLSIEKMELANFLLDAKNFGADTDYAFETFQGSSSISRPDWVYPLTKDYSRRNFMGNNNPDYGGGMPVVDFWTKQQGLAFASLSLKPELISLPVTVTKNGTVSFSISDERERTLQPGEQFEFVPVVIITHHGDYYNALQEYSQMLQSRGFRIPMSPASAREPEWCAWGYGRDFSYQQLLATLPIAARLSFKWATLDDGWQDADGDWGLSPKKFPNGLKDFKAFVDLIHAKGMMARLWWVPLAACDSSYNIKMYPNRMSEYAMKIQSTLAKEHPDWFILDKDGKRYQIDYWNTYVLDPALPEVREYYRRFLVMAIKEWGFDGVKIDGQNFNAVPPCYNPAHHHKSPYESCEAVPKFFQMVYETIYALKDSAVIQLCPCGTNFSLYNIPWTSQFVASDPANSWQVRHRGKTFRALVGNKIPFAGDHVELTNHGWDDALEKEVLLKNKKEDFASTIAVGGVVATKFTAPGFTQNDSTLALTPEREAYYSKWINAARQEKLETGEYLNLYDIAFDSPETHLIKKGQTYYYSFFSDTPFKGLVELRGLPKGKYKVIDYVDHSVNKEINTDHPFLNIEFERYLLLKVEIQ